MEWISVKDRLPVKMKNILIAALILCSYNASAQKIGKNKYNKVASITEYDNASIITYRQNNKTVRDTIWKTVDETGYSVKYCDNLNIYNNTKLKKKRTN